MITETIITCKGLYSTGVGAESICAAEGTLDLYFSSEYKEYLMKMGIAAVNGHELTGISKSDRVNVVSVTKEERMRNPQIPKSWYVVEQAHIDGIVVWQNGEGQIFASQQLCDPVKICDSLDEYIRMG